MRSEDLNARGRILVYEIIDVVPEPGNPQTNHKFKLFCKTDEKAPVTALCGVNGCLLAAIGNKVIMYAIDEGDLDGIAFLDVNIFVVNISSVKNLILISDVYKSVWFVVFQEDPPKLVALGKDFHHVRVYGSEIIVSDTEMAFLVTDHNRNLHVMTYAPYAVQSQGGQRLIRRGEMNTGHHIVSFFKLKARNDMKQYAGIAGTTSGAIVRVLPISEKMYKRMYALYSRLVTHLKHAAGLNPRGYRQIRDSQKTVTFSVISGLPGPRLIIDEDLMSVYLNLPRPKQVELGDAIGSNRNRVIDDLLELGMRCEYF